MAPYDSLNLGMHVGDAAEAVRENRRRICKLLHLPSEPAWIEQVHGTEVSDLDVECPAPRRQRADAVVTRQAGTVCVVQVADCLPVLLAVDDGSAISAVHAGWRGLAAGVLEAAVASLRVAPGRLVAWLGPAIGPGHFEVGDEVRCAFLSRDARAHQAFEHNARGRWQCNLRRLATLRLSALGVPVAYGGNWCTYSDARSFFSYRRDGRCGRMAALIWLQ